MQINRRLPGTVTSLSLRCCLAWWDFNILYLTLSPPTPPSPSLYSCRIMDVALLIMSSPSVPDPLGEPPPNSICFVPRGPPSFSPLLSLCLCCFRFLSFLHTISSRLLFDDGFCFISFYYLRGFRGPVMPEDPEDGGQAKPSQRGAH